VRENCIARQQQERFQARFEAIEREHRFERNSRLR
jgi:hypothetical protein